ncbi:BadF/BadG/BcrA/BcrD ATPase family protein [Martelella soudanensis]|uniref:BadF/BadG/BcrA/BcrD ATPase family protein n=1 Tax=unclassified Martelella TaxID=2629616 RepID=UPI0015DDFA2C|nr:MULTISPECIES: BadF/BadG/BcrA/BcrD ATPase family protein [unclassified Martelella]
MSACYLGCDIGGTASRYAVADATGAIVARGAVPGAGGLVHDPAARKVLEAALAGIAGAMPGPAASAVFGLTGYDPQTRSEVADLVCRACALPPDKLFILDDIELAYRCLFAPGEGHIVAAGTGVIGLHIDVDGGRLRVGGRGMLIDDGGSAGWIALSAIRALYRRLDEDGAPGDMARLAEALYRHAGGSGWPDIRALVYAGDRGRIGEMARAVAEAAEAGDDFSATLLRKAGRELARLGHLLRKRGGDRPVAFTGGALRLSPVIGATIAGSLGDCARFPALDPAAGAAKLALTASRNRNVFRPGNP